jgi:copper chaperone CopZ
MKPKPILLWFSLHALVTLGIPAIAAEPAAFKPHPVTATFYISGVHCGGCVDAITGSLQRVKSVTGSSLEAGSPYANVSFDTHVASYHQIAQAIANTQPMHGEPYTTTLKFKVPDYAKGDNAKQVDAVFAKSASQVRVECTDRTKGEFTLHFLPLKVDKTRQGPQGWNAGKFGHPIHDPAPKGLGLAFALVKEGQAAKK